MKNVIMKKYVMITGRTIMIPALLVICMLQSGCTKRVDEEVKRPVNIACVLGITNNQPIVKADDIDELAGLSELPGSRYSCILADGEPSVICEGEIPDFSDKGYTKNMLKRIEASIQADISAQIDAASPDSPQVDIAAATALAVRTLRANAVEGQDNILVYAASGISTTGLLDMTEIPVCELDAEASAFELANSCNYNMEGLEVIWYYCADVAGDKQPSLSDKEKKTLQSFYETFFLTLGAETVDFVEDIPPAGSYDFVEQPVSVMRTEDTGSVLQAKVVESEKIESVEQLESAFVDGDVLSFSEEVIGFLPDSTELADPAAAALALNDMIDYMSANPEFELLIAGTTTSAGEENSCRVFSKKRAQAVCDLIVEEGIDPARLQVIGLGYTSQFYVPDRKEDGSLDESVASCNRTVKLLDRNSEIAKQIMLTGESGV